MRLLSLLVVEAMIVKLSRVVYSTCYGCCDASYAQSLHGAYCNSLQLHGGLAGGHPAGKFSVCNNVNSTIASLLMFLLY
jgi:hypothetical protein